MSSEYLATSLWDRQSFALAVAKLHDCCLGFVFRFFNNDVITLAALDFFLGQVFELFHHVQVLGVYELSDLTLRVRKP